MFYYPFFWKNKMGNELDKSAFSTALVCIYYYSMTSKNKLNGLISRKFPLLNNKMGVKTTKFTIIGKLFTLLEYSRQEISTLSTNSLMNKSRFSLSRKPSFFDTRGEWVQYFCLYPRLLLYVLLTTYLYEITKSNSKAEDYEFEFYSLMWIQVIF